MKKILAAALAAAMILSMSACATNQNDPSASVSEPSGASEETSLPLDAAEISSGYVADETSDPFGEEPSDGQNNGDSAGRTLLQSFEQIAADGSLSAQEIAEAVVANEIIPFAPTTMPVEPGLLVGFGNTEITDFSEGAMFGPMISTIPFIGYVFKLDDGADAAAFIETLEANADLRWNICTAADEAVSGSAGNMVFFVMSAKDLREGE